MGAERCAVCNGTNVLRRNGVHHACERVEWMREWFARLGFGTHDITIPAVDDRVFEQRNARGMHGFSMELFVQPPEDAIPFAALLGRLQRYHWTMEAEMFHERVAWEPADHWRWFWIEVPETCPRVAMLPSAVNARVLTSTHHRARLPSAVLQTLRTWHREGCDAARAFRACSLEEYAIGLFAMQALERTIDASQDVRTVLRTRCGNGVLLVHGHQQKLFVSSSSWMLAECFQRKRGLRIAETAAV